MAITRVGVGGPSLAYLTFQPKTALEYAPAADWELTASYVPSVSLRGSAQDTIALRGSRG